MIIVMDDSLFFLDLDGCLPSEVVGSGRYLFYLMAESYSFFRYLFI